MKKIIDHKKLKIILLILILISIILFAINKTLNIYLLVLGINQFTINLILAISIIITTILILNYNIKSKLKYVINIIAVLFILFLLFINFLVNTDKKYFYFKSPNKSNTLVVEEYSFLLGGQSTFYERKGFIFIKDLKSKITTDDGYRPFSNNSYDLKWLDNDSAELSYDYGSGSKEYKKVTINFN